MTIIIFFIFIKDLSLIHHNTKFTFLKLDLILKNYYYYEIMNLFSTLFHYFYYKNFKQFKRIITFKVFY